MKRPRWQRGFTVVETLIFLAVSTAVFAVSIAVVSEQQARAEIRYGMEEFSGQIRDIMNDVSTGFYERPQELRCRVNPGTGMLQFAGPGNEIGESKDCIFIGKVFHFQPGDITSIDGDQAFRTYTIVGRRQVDIGGSNKVDVRSLAEATPRAIELDITQTEYIIPYGIRIERATVAGTSTNAFGFGVFTRFAAYENNSTGTIFESNARDVQIVPLGGATGFNRNRNRNHIYNAVENVVDESATRGVELCFESRGYNATVNIGPNGSYNASDLIIDKGGC